MKQIKFNYKEKPFSCGPCALRMVLQTLLDTDIKEEIIIELIGATKEAGASLLLFQKNLSFLLKQICLQFKLDNHFESIIKEDSNLKELQRLQKTGYLIMLNYKKPDGQSHWAVLNDINQQDITLMDPDFGPNYKYQIEQFNWTGGSKTRPTNKAFIAIRYRNS